MAVVIAGGTGGLGSELVQELATRGVDAIPASRRTGFDLATGEGVAEVLADADVIVHAATNVRFRRVDLNGTRRIVRLLTGAGRRPHLIYVSIVGCDLNPYPYYRVKHACEIVLRKSGLPVTVVRATQFHTLIAALAGVARWPLCRRTRQRSRPTGAGSPSSWPMSRSAPLRTATGGPPTWPGQK